MEALMKEIKSSNLEAIGYDKELKILYIKFKSGGLYSYYPVERRTIKKMEESESRGRFFHEHVRDSKSYKVTKIWEGK